MAGRLGVGPGIVWEKWLLRFSEHHEGCGSSGLPCLVCVVKPLGHPGEAGLGRQASQHLVCVGEAMEAVLGVDMELSQEGAVLFHC